MTAAASELRRTRQLARAGVDAQALGLARILFVTSDKFPPFRPAAKAIFSEGLAGKGCRIDWLIQGVDGRTATGIRRYRNGIAYVAPTNSGGTRLARLTKYWADIRNDLRIFGLLKARHYALVQIKDKYVGALIAIAAAKLHRVPVFYWLAYPHGEASLYAARNGVARYAWFYRLRGLVQRWLLYKIIMPASAHIFVQSEQMRADVAGEGIPLHKMTAVPSSLNIEALDTTLAERDRVATTLAAHADRDAAQAVDAGTHDGGPTIVYLGTLLRERRLDFLVDVLARVRRRVADARLVFVGRGEMPEDEELLRRTAERHGVADAVTITGWLPMQAAWEHVRRASVCVSPYYPVPILLSTSPTKLIEYMALGKAVVANDHPEQSLVLKRSGGGLVCKWDAEEFAEAIVLLLKHPSVANDMGQAGRRFVETHRTHSVMVDLVANRYAEVLAGLGAADRGDRKRSLGRNPGRLRRLLGRAHLPGK